MCHAQKLQQKLNKQIVGSYTLLSGQAPRLAWQCRLLWSLSGTTRVPLRFGLLVPALHRGVAWSVPSPGSRNPVSLLVSPAFMCAVLPGTHERAASNRTKVHSSDPPHHASHSNRFSFLFSVHLCSMYTCKYACSHMCVCACVSVETQG